MQKISSYKTIVYFLLSNFSNKILCFYVIIIFYLNINDVILQVFNIHSQSSAGHSQKVISTDYVTAYISSSPPRSSRISSLPLNAIRTNHKLLRTRHQSIRTQWLNPVINEKYVTFTTRNYVKISINYLQWTLLHASLFSSCRIYSLFPSWRKCNQPIRILLGNPRPLYKLVGKVSRSDRAKWWLRREDVSYSCESSCPQATPATTSLHFSTPYKSLFAGTFVFCEY